MLRTALPEIITDTLPGPKAQALIDRRAQAVPAAIRCVYPVAIARGEGAMLEDLDGNRFLDWIGGVGVLNIGYSHPEVIDAVKAQAEQYFHGMFNIVTHEGYVALAEKLAQLAPVRGRPRKCSSPTPAPKPMRTLSRSPGPTPGGPISSPSPGLSTAAPCSP